MTIEVGAGGGADAQAIRPQREKHVLRNKKKDFMFLCRKNKKPARGWFLKTWILASCLRAAYAALRRRACEGSML